MTTTSPSARSCTSIRHRESRSIARRLEATTSSGSPAAWATAGGRRGVGRLVLAEQPQVDALGLGADREVEARAAEVVRGQLAQAYVGSGCQPEGHHVGAGARRHRQDPRVVGVEHGRPGGRVERVDDLALGERDLLLGAELADVGACRR